MRTGVTARSTPSLIEPLVDCKTHRITKCLVDFKTHRVTKYLVDYHAYRLLVHSVNHRRSGCDRIQEFVANRWLIWPTVRLTDQPSE